MIWKKIIKVLFPLNRVHLSEDTFKACKILKENYSNATILKFNKNMKVGLWEIPEKWDVIKAELRNSKNKILLDWKKNKLCLHTYSKSFSGKISLDKLKKHLLSDPSRPSVTPFHFRNQYRPWERSWGFSIPDSKKKSLKKGLYKVNIQTKFTKESMQMVEQKIEGKFKDSILFVGHLDHPQMCNDGLSACIAGHEILQKIKKIKTKLTYRMLSTPEIVGSIFYARKYIKKNNIKECLNLSGCGANAELFLLKSSKEKSNIDRILKHILSFADEGVNFSKFTNPNFITADEIAFDINGNNIPSSSLGRWPIKGYHSNEDNLQNHNTKKFENFLKIVLKLIFIIENNYTIHPKFQSLPRLSHPKLNLYLNSELLKVHLKDFKSKEAYKIYNIDYQNEKRLNEFYKNFHAHLCLSLIDGKNTVLDIAEKTNFPFEVIKFYLDSFVKKRLVSFVWNKPKF